jgi:hypothetical protein
MSSRRDIIDFETVSNMRQDQRYPQQSPFLIYTIWPMGAFCRYRGNISSPNDSVTPHSSYLKDVLDLLLGFDDADAQDDLSVSQRYLNGAGVFFRDYQDKTTV